MRTEAEHVAIEALTDIFERADMECYYRRLNRETQGQWRNVMLIAKSALRAVKAPIPQAMGKTKEQK